MQTPATIRKSRIDKGLLRLTQRDRVLLSWIGEQYAVRIDTLRVLLSRTSDTQTLASDALQHSSTDEVQNNYMTERNVRRIIKRWQDGGLVKYQKILYDEPAELYTKFLPDFHHLVADLGIQSSSDLQQRSKAVRAFLPSLWQVTGGDSRSQSGC